MAYGSEIFRDLTRKTVFDKILDDKAFVIDKDAKYDEYQRNLASMVFKFSHKKFTGGAVKNQNMENQELAEELHKPIIRKFEKRKVYWSFTDNICDADLANM